LALATGQLAVVGLKCTANIAEARTPKVYFPSQRDMHPTHTHRVKAYPISRVTLASH